MNVIVKFNREDARQEFVLRAEKACPQLLEKIYMAKRRPHAVFESLAEEEHTRLMKLVEGLGQVFEDVKFELMSPR